MLIKTTPTPNNDDKDGKKTKTKNTPGHRGNTICSSISCISKHGQSTTHIGQCPSPLSNSGPTLFLLGLVFSPVRTCPGTIHLVLRASRLLRCRLTANPSLLLLPPPSGTCVRVRVRAWRETMLRPSCPRRPRIRMEPPPVSSMILHTVTSYRWTGTATLPEVPLTTNYPHTTVIHPPRITRGGRNNQKQHHPCVFHNLSLKYAPPPTAGTERHEAPAPPPPSQAMREREPTRTSLHYPTLPRRT